MPGIRDMLRGLSVPFVEAGQTPQATHGWVMLDCPYCGKPGKPGLGINTQSLRCNCWKCGKHWIGHVLRDATQRPLGDIMRLLAELDTFITPQPEEKPTGRYIPPDDVGPLEHAHRQYLKKRRLDPDEMTELWGLGGIGLSERLAWRVFLPVHVHNKPVSWTTRAIGDRVEKRYHSAKANVEESVPIKSTLYGLDHVRHTVLICEGPFDVLAIGPGSVCTYGLRYSWRQVLLLSQIPLRLVCADNSPDAQRVARQLASHLSVFPGVTKIVELGANTKDPGAASDEERKELRSLLL